MKFKLCSSVVSVTVLRCSRVRRCSTVIVGSRSTASDRRGSLLRFLSKGDRVSRCAHIRLAGVATPGRGKDIDVCICIPRGARGFGRSMALHSEGSRRRCRLASSKTIVYRGATSLVNIGTKSGVVLRGSGEGCGMGVATIARGCVKRCICVAPPYCRGAFKRGPGCSDAMCAVGRSTRDSLRALKGTVLGCPTTLDVDCADDATNRMRQVLNSLKTIV